MVQYNLGKVVGNDGAKGDTGDKGDKGDTGNGIQSITKTSTSGKIDTYTIIFTNGETSNFTVTNGNDATVEIVDNLNSTASDKALSAKQGKVLKDLIGDAIVYINQ